MHYTQTQSSAPADGRNYRPKHVELIEIINKLLLLHPVGCFYYCIRDVRSLKHQIFTVCMMLKINVRELQASLCVKHTHTHTPHTYVTHTTHTTHTHTHTTHTTHTHTQTHHTHMSHTPHTHTYVCVCVRACMYIYIYMYVCACIYIYIYIHTKVLGCYRQHGTHVHI